MIKKKKYDPNSLRDLLYEATNNSKKQFESQIENEINKELIGEILFDKSNNGRVFEYYFKWNEVFKNTDVNPVFEIQKDNSLSNRYSWKNRTTLLYAEKVVESKQYTIVAKQFFEETLGLKVISMNSGHIRVSWDKKDEEINKNNKFPRDFFQVMGIDKYGPQCFLAFLFGMLFVLILLHFV